MANEKNLEKGAATRFKSGEEAVNAGRKGGIASGESKRRTKTFREAMLALLDGVSGNEEQRKALEAFGLEPTYRNIISLANVVKAAGGDTTATVLVRDTVGEKPRDGLEIGNLDGKPLECLELSKLTDEELIAMIGH